MLYPSFMGRSLPSTYFNMVYKSGAKPGSKARFLPVRLIFLFSYVKMRIDYYVE